MWKTLVWPVASYGRETWTLKKADQDCISAFEMKGLRQILRVSWTEKKTNEWVLEKAGVTQAFLATIRKRKLTYFGHVTRKPSPCLEKEIIQGALSGQRKRGRSRTSWFDNITAWTGLTLESVLRTAADRDKWRRQVHDAANPRIEDG